MKKRLIAVFTTAVMLCEMLFIVGYSSAQYSDIPDIGNKPLATPLPPIPAELLKKIETDMVKIPAGTPPAGSRASSYNKKVPEIKIQSFMLSRHEVTQEQFRRTGLPAFRGCGPGRKRFVYGHAPCEKP